MCKRPKGVLLKRSVLSTIVIMAVCCPNLTLTKMCRYTQVVRYSNTKTYSTGSKSILVTCGKCSECIKTYQNDWMLRNWYQLQDTKVAVFFTLTYDESNVPVGYSDDEMTCLSVCKEHLRKFLKLFREYRRRNNLSTDFKYFVTSEYGPRTRRPHYHGLLHGIRLKECMPFLQNWRKTYGFVQFDEINYCNTASAQRRCRYVAKYCSKGDFENPYVAQGLVEKNFHFISNGLGKSFLTPQRYDYYLVKDFPVFRKYRTDGKLSDDYLAEVRKRLVVPLGGFDYHMPRYYREKIFAKSISLQMQYSDYVCKCLLDDNKAKLVEVSSQLGSREILHEAYALVHLQDVSEKMDIEKEAIASHKQFYNRSKI